MNCARKSQYAPVLALLLTLVCAAAARSQEERPVYGWKVGLLEGFKLTQAGFSNWAAGGENTLAWQLTSTNTFLYEQEAYDWSNWLKLGYGLVRVGDEESRKSTDETKLESKLTVKFDGPLGLYAALYAETQFARGYEYTDTDRTAISNFMDPGYFTESAGMSYTYGKMVTTRAGFAAKQTVTDEFRKYSDDPDTEENEALRAQYGAEWVTDLKYELSDKLVYIARVNFFADMKALTSTDVRWDNSFAAGVAPYVDVTFDFNLLYDREISTAVQMKNALAIGLVLKYGAELE